MEDSESEFCIHADEKQGRSTQIRYCLEGNYLTKQYCIHSDKLQDCCSLIRRIVDFVRVLIVPDVLLLS